MLKQTVQSSYSVNMLEMMSVSGEISLYRIWGGLRSDSGGLEEVYRASQYGKIQEGRNVMTHAPLASHLM